jgi:uncharacterized cupredoxin-like copper-binding protein
MARLIIFAAFVVLSAASSLPSEAGSGPAGHRHDTAGFSSGEPGDAKKPLRVIQVTMQEHDGKMLFVPDRVEIRKGEQIKFVLYNSGELDHEFVLATTQENLKHAEAMKKNPDMVNFQTISLVCFGATRFAFGSSCSRAMLARYPLPRAHIVHQFNVT